MKEGSYTINNWAKDMTQQEFNDIVKELTYQGNKRGMEFVFLLKGDDPTEDMKVIKSDKLSSILMAFFASIQSMISLANIKFKISVHFFKYA
jgi:hypothetical protein